MRTNFLQSLGSTEPSGVIVCLVHNVSYLVFWAQSATRDYTLGCQFYKVFSLLELPDYLIVLGGYTPTLHLRSSSDSCILCLPSVRMPSLLGQKSRTPSNTFSSLKSSLKSFFNLSSWCVCVCVRACVCVCYCCWATVSVCDCTGFITKTTRYNCLSVS